MDPVRRQNFVWHAIGDSRPFRRENSFCPKTTPKNGLSGVTKMHSSEFGRKLSKRGALECNWSFEAILSQFSIQHHNIISPSPNVVHHYLLSPSIATAGFWWGRVDWLVLGRLESLGNGKSERRTISQSYGFLIFQHRSAPTDQSYFLKVTKCVQWK